MIYRLIFLVFGVLAAITDGYAQSLQVKRFVLDPTDISAQVMPRHDLNGELCALVKVEIAAPKAEFKGDIVAPAPEFEMGQYWVYMTGKDPEARYLIVWAPGYLPLTLDFTEYPTIGSLKSGSTYLLTIEMPGADPNVIMGGISGQSASAPAQQQPVKPQGARQIYANFTTPYNLYLACECEGAYFYFSETDWRNLSAAEQSRFTKKGVVVIGDGERFILDLNDSGSRMTWDEAIRRYGNRLPTKSQGMVMAKNYEAINKAIIYFGGDKNPEWRYWTRTEYNSSYAWYVHMYVGIVTKNNKADTNRVRAVAVVPVASAM